MERPSALPLFPAGVNNPRTPALASPQEEEDGDAEEAAREAQEAQDRLRAQNAELQSALDSAQPFMDGQRVPYSIKARLQAMRAALADDGGDD